MKLESALTFIVNISVWYAHVYLIFQRLTGKEFFSWKYFCFIHSMIRKRMTKRQLVRISIFRFGTSLKVSSWNILSQVGRSYRSWKKRKKKVASKGTLMTNPLRCMYENSDRVANERPVKPIIKSVQRESRIFFQESADGITHRNFGQQNRPQVCATRRKLWPADDGKVRVGRTFTQRPILRRWRRRSARVNDENCIASRNAAGINIRTKGAPRVREGQLKWTCETYGRDGREDEEVSSATKKLTFLVHAPCMQAGWPRRRSFRAGKTACRPPQCVSFHRRRCGVQEGRRINALPDGG